MTCDPVPVVETIYDGLIDDTDFPIPDVSGIVMPTLPALDNDLFLGMPEISIEDLTEGKTNGSGVFDKLMTSVTAHLDRERAAGRITNNDFAKSYVEFSTAALGSALQFVLQKDQAKWAAIAAQNQAKLVIVELTKAEIELEEAKMRMQLMAFQAAGAKAQVALSKMQLATAKVDYCTSEYNLAEILPKQADNLTAQKLQIEAQTDQVTAQTGQIALDNLRIQAQTAQITEQTARIVIENALTEAQTDQVITQTASIALEDLRTQAQTAQVVAQTGQIAIQTDMIEKQIDQITAQITHLGFESAQVQAQTLQTTAQTGQITAQTLNIEAQTTHTAAQTANTAAQTANVLAQTSTLLPQQVRQTSAAADGQVLQNTTIIPKQGQQLDEQIKLSKEQTETQRAQTMDTRSDGVTVITGTLGKQKELHAQQIVSYQRDSQLKAARPFIDAWITMKTIDEGTLPPTGFTNANLDQVLAILRSDNDL